MNKIVTRPSPGDKNLMESGGLERRREIIQTALARSKAQRAAKEQRAPSTLDERIRRVNEVTGETLPAPKFKSLAENIIAIVVAERGGPVDPRLIRASAGANINSPPGRRLPDRGTVLPRACCARIRGVPDRRSLRSSTDIETPCCSQDTGHRRNEPCGWFAVRRRDRLLGR
jgi:hypothetical protein